MRAEETANPLLICIWEILLRCSSAILCKVWSDQFLLGAILARWGQCQLTTVTSSMATICTPAWVSPCTVEILAALKPFIRNLKIFVLILCRKGVFISITELLSSLSLHNCLSPDSSNAKASQSLAHVQPSHLGVPKNNNRAQPTMFQIACPATLVRFFAFKNPCLAGVVLQMGLPSAYLKIIIIFHFHYIQGWKEWCAHGI